MTGELPFTIHDHPTLLAQLRALGPFLWGSDEVAEEEIRRIQAVPGTPFSRRDMRGHKLRSTSLGRLVVGNPFRCSERSSLSPLANATVQAVDGWVGTANSLAESSSSGRSRPRIVVSPGDTILALLDHERRWTHNPECSRAYADVAIWRSRFTPFILFEIGVVGPRLEYPVEALPMDLYLGLHLAYVVAGRLPSRSQPLYLILTGTFFKMSSSTWATMLVVRPDGNIELSCTTWTPPLEQTLYPFFYPVGLEEREDIPL